VLTKSAIGAYMQKTQHITALGSIFLVLEN